MKFFAGLRSGHTPSRLKPEYWENCHIPWFSLADVWQLRDGQRMYLGETKEKISDLGLANSAADLLPSGTVILSRTASVGFSGIMPASMATTQDFVNWIPSNALISEYLLFIFRGMVSEFDRLKMGSTHKTIYMPDVRQFSCPVPPLDEQIAIISYLKRKLSIFEQATKRANDLMELLKERRTALISAAVTGKIDVRGWKAPESETEAETA
jgi:type I restriction enzyme, S subunit